MEAETGYNCVKVISSPTGSVSAAAQPEVSNMDAGDMPDCQTIPLSESEYEGQDSATDAFTSERAAVASDSDAVSPVDTDTPQNTVQGEGMGKLSGRGKRASMTENQQAEIRRFYQDGMPSLEIATRLKLTESQVNIYIGNAFRLRRISSYVESKYIAVRAKGLPKAIQEVLGVSGEALVKAESGGTSGTLILSSLIVQ